MSINIHPAIAAIDPYVPGRLAEDVEREFGIVPATKLASNENALGPSPSALATMQNMKDSLNRYPDGTGNALRKALAQQYKVEVGQVILGNGSDELISLLVKVSISPGDDAITATPSFSIYDKAVRAGLGNIISLPLTNYAYDLSAMHKAITPRTKVLFICNPNNPTGTIVNTKQLCSLLHKIPKHILVVLDEAYAEYVTDPNYPDSITLQTKGHSLIVLRTFSKIYGLAGLRIGYAIAPLNLADAMNKVRMPFNTNTLAQNAALAALNDIDHINASNDNNQRGKLLLYKTFDELSLPFIPSEANFIYFDTKKNGKIVFEALLRFGVIVRHIDGSMLRVTIGLPEENEKFILALRTIIQNPSPVHTNGLK